MNTETSTLHRNAARLRALHRDGLLVLPNAWDAASAGLIARAGAQAIATTSGGMAWSLGFADGEQISRSEMIAGVARIAAAVDLPVTADIEGGYGPGHEDVAQTVTAVIGAGAVGINLEDSTAPGGPLFTVEAQCERIAAARGAGDQAGLTDLLINIRSDVFLFGIGAPEARVDDVLTRAAAYAAAGADSLFVPGLLDLGTLSHLVARSPLPVNVMAGPGGPTVTELISVGIRRISVGTAIAQASYQVAAAAARELLENGTFAAIADAVPFGELNALFES